MAIKNKIEVLYVISDLHLPYHNEKLWKILKDILRTTPKNKTIVINGDFLEMHIMSSYAKSKHCIADFEMELEAAISELKELRKYCKRMIFIEGNHENRLFKLIQNNCPQIMRIDFASCIASYLKLSDINIEFIPFDSEQFFMPWENVRFGIQHAPPDQGRHCARNTLDKNQVSTLFGHCHRTMTSA